MEQTKMCKECGRELPLQEFYMIRPDMFRSICKKCYNLKHKDYYYRRKNTFHDIPNPLLKDITSQELITELRVRGYKGTLSYTETKTHTITL